MFWFNLFAKIINLLHSDDSPRSIAGGFALGAIIGLTPLMSLHNLFVFCLVLLINVSIPAACFGIFLCSGFAYLLDPVFHKIGYYLLVNVAFLKPFWTYLYNIPVAPLLRLNNTVVLGSLVTALLAFIPNYFGFKQVVCLYRLHLKEKVEQLKVIQFLKARSQASTLYQTYMKIRAMGV